MTKKRATVFIALALSVLVLVAAVFCFLGKNSHEYYESDGSYRHISAKDSFAYAEGHPAFAPFSTFIQPWKDETNLLLTPHMSIDTVCRQNNTNTQSILDGFNFVIDSAQKYKEIYYDFYTQQEREDDPTKEETGLIFIPGEKDAPVAVLTSGGAFKSVCLFLEGFPVGNILHHAGYHVVILKYRVNPNADASKETMEHQEQYANEDYGRAMQYLFDHQQGLGFSMEGYSVWGFSAGGRTTFLWGLDNDYGYKAWDLPAPAAMILVYSGWYDAQFEGQYNTVPPTYLAWLPNDDVIGQENIEGIRRYIDLLDQMDIPYAQDTFYEAKHGFGEGRGTDAEGWVQDAAAFWETQRQTEK